jgi:hypothetical protein
LPIFTTQNTSTSTEIINSAQKQILSEYLDILTFIEPELSEIADRLTDRQHFDHRVFMHVDYVVPEDHELADLVEQNHQLLRDLWSQKKVPLASFRYNSASLDRELACLVYPVCIYYFQRAKYLCAWGCRTDRGITWHNYRLDRIQLDSLVEIPWDSNDIPDELT